MENDNSSKVFDVVNTGIDIKKQKKLIRHIRTLDLKHANFEYLKSILAPLLNSYFISSTTVNTEELIYRAVPWVKKPENKTQLSYPPTSKVKL